MLRIGFQHGIHYESNLVPTFQHSVQLDSSEEFTASSSEPAYDGPVPLVLMEGSQEEAFPFAFPGQTSPWTDY